MAFGWLGGTTGYIAAVETQGSVHQPTCVECGHQVVAGAAGIGRYVKLTLTCWARFRHIWHLHEHLPGPQSSAAERATVTASLPHKPKGTSDVRSASARAWPGSPSSPAPRQLIPAQPSSGQ